MTHLQKARQILAQGNAEFLKFVRNNSDDSINIWQGSPSPWVIYMKGTAMPLNRDAAYHLGFVYPSWEETPAVVLEFFWYVQSYNELIAKWDDGVLDPELFPTIGRNFPGHLDAFLATE